MIVLKENFSMNVEIFCSLQMFLEGIAPTVMILIIVTHYTCRERDHLLWTLFPRLVIKPVAPALAGRFLTTGPPGKSWQYPSLVTALVVCNSQEQE